MDVNEEELAKVIVELVRRDGRLRSAIMQIVCECPNVVTQY